MAREIYFVISVFLIHICGNSAETVNLTIADGDIKGQVNTTIRNNVTYYNFRGIPYAQPPLGNLRFTSPVKNSAWNGTWDATYDRSQCIQYTSDDFVNIKIGGQEDCLYINVYTPDYNTTGLPVLVWIYGGGFLLGNSSYHLCGPDFFLEQGLVFVSFNYRLGIFGFLSTEDEACPGNWGIKDQILALKWVQENIGYFGGDPNKVTIYGQSAGSASVHLLMQTKLTEGLFNGVIMNSGTTLNLWALITRPLLTAQLVAVELGITTTNTTKLVEALRDVEAEKLLFLSWATGLGLLASNGLRGFPFGPTMEPDIEGAVYIHPSDTALREGKFREVPVLMGFNSNEAATAEYIPSLLKFYLLYYDIAVELLTPYSMTSDETKRLQAGKEIKYEYFGLESIAASLEKLDNFISADQFNRPIRRAAADMSNYTTVYFYEFGYQGYVAVPGHRNVEGVGHAEDNHYLFRSYNHYTETDVKVSEMMVLLWANFAKFGNPTPAEDSKLNNTIWSPVDPFSINFTYMSLNESMVESVNPKQSDWQFYTRLWSKYGTENETTTY